MKKFKKIFAAIAASALVAAMSFTSMAASITIDIAAPEGTSNKDLTTTYEYYKVLNANVLYKNDDPNDTEIQNASYYLDKNSDAKMLEAIKSTNLFTIKESTVSTRVNVELKDPATTGETIATKLNEAITNANIDRTGTFVQNSEKNAEGKDVIKAEATDLSDGYYLVKSSFGTAIVVSTTGEKNVTIREKNKYPSLKKEEDITTASYGEKITYTVTVSIPNTAAAEDIIVVDTMTSGLTPFDGDDTDNLLDVTAKVNETVLTGDKAVTVDSQNKNVIKIKIPAAAVTKYKGNDVVLTYQAVLNNNANTNVAETNTAHLEYADYKSLDKSVDVTTYGFKLTKVDGAKKKDATDRFIPATAGDAEFTLYKSGTGNDKIYVVKDKDTNTYQITTTVTDTKILAGGVNHDATIVGLAAGKYYLQEDEAPTGYNKLAERKPITVVSGENAAAENKVEVENNAGIKLPSTGGMGTTVFAIVGLLVMAGAAVTLIVKKRA